MVGVLKSNYICCMPSQKYASNTKISGAFGKHFHSNSHNDYKGSQATVLLESRADDIAFVFHLIRCVTFSFCPKACRTTAILLLPCASSYRCASHKCKLKSTPNAPPEKKKTYFVYERLRRNKYYLNAFSKFLFIWPEFDTIEIDWEAKQSMFDWLQYRYFRQRKYAVI